MNLNSSNNNSKSNFLKFTNELQEEITKNLSRNTSAIRRNLPNSILNDSLSVNDSLGSSPKNYFNNSLMNKTQYTERNSLFVNKSFKDIHKNNTSMSNTNIKSNNNLKNILNGNNVKKLEINFNKYDMKILTNKNKKKNKSKF